jgi:hypothetical protein
VSGFGLVRATEASAALRRDTPAGHASPTLFGDVEPDAESAPPPLRRESLKADLERFRRERLHAAPDGKSASSAAARHEPVPALSSDDRHSGGMGELVELPRDAAGNPYPLTDLQRLQLTRLRYKREMTRRDAKDVLRRNADEYVRRMPGLDPVARQQNQERIRRVAQEIMAEVNGDGGGDGTDVATEDAILAAVERMTDEELREALRAGAIDPAAMWELGASEALPLPNEFLDVASAPSTLVREIVASALQPAEPTDEEAAVLDRFERGEKADFTDLEIELLAKYETRTSSMHTVQPNEVLRYVAAIDPSVAQSLRVLDRAKRAALRDGGFQRALMHTKRVGDAEAEKLTARAKGAKAPSAVDNSFFTHRESSAPPKSFAMSAHDEDQEVYNRSHMGQAKQRQRERRLKARPSLQKGQNFTNRPL